jgi:hypothetical protein
MTKTVLTIISHTTSGQLVSHDFSSRRTDAEWDIQV